jgi:hypothetical protein
VTDGLRTRTSFAFTRADDVDQPVLAVFEAHPGDELVASGRHLAELLGHRELLAGRGLLLELRRELLLVPRLLHFLHPVADAAHAAGS